MNELGAASSKLAQAGHFSGPLITGDGIDMSGDGSALLTASQRDDDQAQLAYVLLRSFQYSSRDMNTYT